jgi:8-oxo-dGTP diphosphatase
MARRPAKEDSEASFLARYDPGDFDRFSLAIDVVLLSAFDKRLHTLLVKRHEHPFKDRWALPGGFVRKAESLDQAAVRVLRDKGGFSDVFLEQLYTFGAVGRDPRTRVITVAHYALVEAARFVMTANAKEDACTAIVEVPWQGESGGPVVVRPSGGEALTLAFDHAAILGLTVKRLRGKLDYAPVAFALLEEEFTLLDLQHVHEAVLGHVVNKDSFRRRILGGGLVEPTGRLQSGVVHRPAELYRYRDPGKKMR